MGAESKSSIELIKLLRAVESSDEAIFMTDIDGTINYVNPGFTKLYGYNYEEVVGKCTPRILKSGLMKEEEYKSFWETILSKNVVKTELINKTKDGQILNINGSANPILDEDGEIVGFIGIQQNITSRKWSEEALRQSENKFRQAFMTSPDSVNINRLSDGLFVTINEGFTKILGYSEKDVIGKTSVELGIWVEAESRKNLVALLMQNQRADDFEALFRHKNGSIIIGLMSATLIEIDGFPHILNITKDITRRKQVEESLSREQFLSNALLNNLPDHVYFKDSESRFIRNNKAHALSFGFDDPKDMVGKSDYDFFTEEAASKAYNDEQIIILTGVPMIKEEKLTRKDNSVVWFSAMKLPLYDNKGKIVGTFGISRDISEKKKTEEALLHSEERFRSVTESANDAIISVNSKGIIIGWNRGATETFGYNEKEISGKSLKLIIPENFLEIVGKSMKKLEIWAEDKAVGNTIEATGLKKNGTEFPVELSLARWLTADGKFFTGIVRDITMRKRTELENMINYEISRGVTTTSNLDDFLKLVHESLSKVVYAENIFIALHDINTGLFNFPYFIDKFDTIPSAAALKKSCTAYVFNSGKPLLLSMDIFDSLVEKGEVELVGSNSPSWVGIPLPSPSRTIGVLVLQHYEQENVYTDIDIRFLSSIGSQIAIAIERKQSEIALLENEKDLNESQKIAGLGSYKLDFITGRWINSAILDVIFGIDENYDRSIQGWIDIIHPDWQDKMLEYLNNEVVVNKKPFDREYKIIRKNDASERWVHGRGELVEDPDKQFRMLIGNIVDITDRKLAEEEIRLKNDLLQTINAEKDKFFSILAHDLRGPLSAFVAATQILTEDVHNMSLDEIKDISLSMKSSATNIYTLLENLLEWSRLQRGVMEYVPEKFNLKRQILLCVNVLSESAKKKKIELLVSVQDDIEIVADKHMFDAITRNLVSNALKFTPVGGSVKVHSDRVNGNSIVVKISDSGIGMTPELINKLFILNEKTSRKGTDGESSTGLGLLLCKEFVEKHNGTITVESEVGNGSTFSFTIPVPAQN